MNGCAECDKYERMIAEAEAEMDGWISLQLQADYQAHKDSAHSGEGEVVGILAGEDDTEEIQTC